MITIVPSKVWESICSVGTWYPVSKYMVVSVSVGCMSCTPELGTTKRNGAGDDGLGSRHGFTLFSCLERPNLQDNTLFIVYCQWLVRRDRVGSTLLLRLVYGL